MWQRLNRNLKVCFLSCSILFIFQCLHCCSVSSHTKKSSNNSQPLLELFFFFFHEHSQILTENMPSCSLLITCVHRSSSGSMRFLITLSYPENLLICELLLGVLSPGNSTTLRWLHVKVPASFLIKRWDEFIIIPVKLYKCLEKFLWNLNPLKTGCGSGGETWWSPE